MAKSLSITEETADSLREQLGVPFSADSTEPLERGKWFIRTVSFHLVGEIVRRSGTFLVLRNASWIADSGRFMQAIKEGTLAEVEPVGDAVVNLNSVVDAFPWKHALPTAQK